MPIAFHNLDAKVKGMLNRGYPDIGQVFYMVDSDFRTLAQGWSKADRTGPLDLWAGQNNQGTEYVYRTGDYDDDAQALQAAMDAAVDFRSDIIHFTSGAYSIGTVITVDVPNIRLLGPPVGHPKSQRATITATVALALTVSVDDVEMGFLRFVPLTAQPHISVSTGADRGYVHGCYYDAQGVSANTATEWFNMDDTTADWLFEDVSTVVNGLQGDVWTIDGGIGHTFNRMDVMTKVASYASVWTLGTDCEGILVTDSHFHGDFDGTFLAVFTGETDKNGQVRVYRCTTGLNSLATEGAFETGFGTAQDIEISSCDFAGVEGVPLTIA